MRRLGQTFTALRERGERALVAYLTAGDPDLRASEELVLAAAEAGADVIELGVPFSDPVADGPVIQQACQRALAAGTTLRGVLRLVEAVRKHSPVPLVLFGYYNPFYAFGLRALATAAGQAGVDGLLVVDLPPEELAEMKAESEPAGLDTILLVAPTTTPDRLRWIVREASGFLYLVAVTGVTGARPDLAYAVDERIREIRRLTALPICVGFGIATAQQAVEAGRMADGVVVGSALVQLVEAHRGAPAPVQALIRDLKGALSGR
ncbi:MAG: tryptophan synthase subunit alpha [Deltaproteobacteria bacterium]|nr:tryptophan synthase subunit alpha [Deltaproteobacteria bacterium]MBI3076552.1 tryptophan synthase subunit alpha [Deltaproteobacteria bacterium]